MYQTNPNEITALMQYLSRFDDETRENKILAYFNYDDSILSNKSTSNVFSLKELQVKQELNQIQSTITKDEYKEYRERLDEQEKKIEEDKEAEKSIVLKFNKWKDKIYGMGWSDWNNLLLSKHFTGSIAIGAIGFLTLFYFYKAVFGDIRDQFSHEYTEYRDSKNIRSKRKTMSKEQSEYYENLNYQDEVESLRQRNNNNK